MSLLVLAYPTLSDSDLETIRAIRAEHDALYYDVVGAHFTIVFPEPTMDPKDFSDHVRKSVEGFGAFPFVLRCAVLVKDSFSDTTHVFLVPDEGYSAVVRLHDLLYRGPLAPSLRLDLPFIPHVGVGGYVDPAKSKALVDDLNARNLEIRGTVDVLDVVSYENDRVETLERIAL